MGGCDCIRPVSLIYDAIDHAWVRNWHVVLEGAVLAAKPFLEYHRQGRDVRFILLDPPLRSSLARIKARQKQKGQVTPFSPEVIAERGRIAHDAYVEAGQIGMTTMQFHTPFIDAVPWILAQLRSV